MDETFLWSFQQQTIILAKKRQLNIALKVTPLKQAVAKRQK